MKIASSLSSADRKLLIVCLSIVAVLVIATGIFAPRADDKSPVPSSYSAGEHGAKAAYLLLLRSGYQVQRWERPLEELLPNVDSHAVLIVAQPYFASTKESKATIKQFLDRGGRILTTGFAGGYLLPREEMSMNVTPLAGKACVVHPEAFNTLAKTSEAHMAVPVSWGNSLPDQRVEYTCADHAAVVSYRVGNGTAIWWASSTPLENAGLMEPGNLDLFLNSVGPIANARVYWDESLHGDIKGIWSHTQGTPVMWLWLQAGFLALMVILSRSRRSGPLRPLPEVSRSSPVEFVTSLGALYQKAGATNTAVTIAYERFKHLVERQIGFGPRKMELHAPELAEAIQRRSGADEKLLKNLTACEEAAFDDKMPPRIALSLIQSLHDHASQLQLHIQKDGSHSEHHEGQSQ